MKSEPSIVERFKQHWLISAVLVCIAVAATTWEAAKELIVAPREYQIDQLKQENVKLREDIQKLETAALIPHSPTDEISLVYAETGVFENASITTNDGICSIHIVSVDQNQVTLAVTIDTASPVAYKNQKAGSRITADAGERVYYIDLHRIRGNIVDLSVHQRRK